MKTIAESTLEDYYRREVMRAGGKTRKLLGEIHDTDQLTIWPAATPYTAACVHFVELKRPGGKAESHQAREHARMLKMGQHVMVLDTIEKIDGVFA